MWLEERLSEEQKARILNENYLSRFSEEDKQKLKRNGICIELANSYDLQYDVGDLVQLVQCRCSASQAKEYNSGFIGMEIGHLFKVGCHPKIAEAYDRRFWGEVTTFVIHNQKTGRTIDIDFEKGVVDSNSGREKDTIDLYYHSEPYPRVSIKDLVGKLSSRTNFADKYQQNINMNFSVIGREEDFKIWTEFAVGKLFSAGCPPENANSYHERFSGSTVADFFKVKCPSKVACRYFSLGLVYGFLPFLFSKGGTPEVVGEFGRRFSGDEITRLLNAKVPASVANSYDKVFGGDDCISLLGYLVRQDQPFSLVRFARPCPPKLAKEYYGSYPHPSCGQDGKKFKKVDGLVIMRLIQAGCPPEAAKRYNKVYFGSDIATLFKAGCFPEQAESYATLKKKGFKAEDISSFFKANMPPSLVTAYNPRFEGGEIVKLHLVGCAPSETDLYGALNGSSIALLYQFGLTPKRITEQKAGEETLVNLVQRMIKSNPKNFSLFRVGKHSLVVLDKEKESAYKVSSSSLKPERAILRKLRQDHGHLKNIINLREEDLQNDPIPYLELEYIDGKTLEQIIDVEKKRLNQHQIVNYSLGILEALNCLLESDVIHGDIHPGNILIEEFTGRPVVIDFQHARLIADDYPLDLSGGRRYRGLDDLFSLGLLLYKMCTGMHLAMDYAAQISSNNKGLPPFPAFNFSTNENKDQIEIYKEHLLTEKRDLKEESKQFISQRLEAYRHTQFEPLVKRLLGIIGFINEELPSEKRLTKAGVELGEKIPWAEVKPIKKELLEELIGFLAI